MEALTDEEISLLLERTQVAHVGLARDGRAYVIPVFFAFDGETLWFHSHHGLKGDYLEATEEACATITTVETEQVWASVQAFGPIEEVEMDSERRRAMDALLERPSPPQMGDEDPGELFFWRLRPTRISGRKSVKPREPDLFDIQ